VSRARLVITAVIVEGRKPAEVAAAYEVSRSWLYELLARHKSEGRAAFDAVEERAARSGPSSRLPRLFQRSEAGMEAPIWSKVGP